MVAGDVGLLLLDVDLKRMKMKNIILNILILSILFVHLVDATESRFERIFGFETRELTLVILW